MTRLLQKFGRSSCTLGTDVEFKGTGILCTGGTLSREVLRVTLTGNVLVDSSGGDWDSIDNFSYLGWVTLIVSSLQHTTDS